MNILFLSQIVPYPPHGGVLQRGFNLIREIHRFGRIHLIAFVHSDTLPTPESIEESRRELGKFCETVAYVPLWPKASIWHGYACASLSMASSLPFSVIAHRSGEFRKAMERIIASYKIDLIHIDTIALAQYVPQGNDIPRVLTHHNVESKLMERRAGVETGILSRIFMRRQSVRIRAFEKEMCPLFDTNIFVSEVDAGEMTSLAPRIACAVVPNGVDTDYFSPRRETQSPPSLIYAGGMNMFANRDAVLYFLREIWPAVKFRRPEVVFYAVGQDPPPELLLMARKDPSIRVTGYVADVRPRIAEASVYVVPLRIGGGTRLKILDAMAMGKAVLSTGIGCEGIDVTPGENIVVADEPGRFAGETVALIGNEKARLRLGAAARRLVESRYSWGVIGEKLKRTYEEAMTKRRSAG